MKTTVDTPWPVNISDQPTLSETQISRAQDVAERRLQDDHGLQAEWFRRKDVASGWAPGASLYIEDHRSIELATDAGAKPFEYRSLGLAGDGDYFVVSAPRNVAFEHYISNDAGLGAPTVLEVPVHRSMPSKRLATACISDDIAMNALTKVARDNNGLNIVPFMSTGDVWKLGVEIARRSHRQVHIAGPPPGLTVLANNKLWFAELVRALIGRDALPPTYEVYGLANAASGIRKLAGVTDKIVIKMPASAGAMGNIVFNRSDFDHSSLTGILDKLANSLSAIGWQGQFPLLLGVWEKNVKASPSVQMWLPHPAQGPPIIEGLFVQTLSEDRGGFVGAEPARLSDPFEQQLKREALKIALTLQLMGYFGRLSLDAVLLSDTEDHTRVHWIEANARWGGVSIPMTIAQKIDPDAMNRGLLIVQKAMSNDHFLNLQQILSTANVPQVAMHSGAREGVFFLAPPEGGQLLFAVVGFSTRQATAIAQSVLASASKPA